jgi:5'-methylthioadenosine/S-adenosylhomocysteine nucleosidase
LHNELGVEVLETLVEGQRIFVGKSGVGTVNGAMMTVLADQRFNLDAILLFGVGGSLDSKLNVGDLVVSKRIVQHDAIFSGDVDDLMAPGELYLSLKPEERESPQMTSSEVLTQFLTETAQKKGHRVFSGTVLSGNEFAARVDRKKEIASLDSDSLLVDMEAAGIAQVAKKLKIPVAAAKTVADRFSPDAGIADDYKTFLKAASEHSSDIFVELLKRFGRKP